jgi:hypothetical protein
MSDFGKHDAAFSGEPLQTVVQLNVYRYVGGQFEYLLLKRIDTDSKFWQVVTEPVHSSATIGDTLRQAASEQIGLKGFKSLSDVTYSYEWYTHGDRGRDIVFAAEVSPEAVITLDQHRFNDYAWLPISEAVQHLKWDGNRTALKQLDDRLSKESRASTYTATHTQTPRSEPPLDQPQGNNQPPDDANSGPYGSNVPKRLPDQPQTVVNTPVKEVNPGEFFL